MKKEEQRRAMQIELQKQIEEKQRKKDIQKEKERLEELRDEQRIRNQIQQAHEEFKKEEGTGDPSSTMRARNTQFDNDQNHHQINVIGSSAGQQNMPSPRAQTNAKFGSMPQQTSNNVQHSPIKRIDQNPKMDAPQEESIGGLMAMGQGNGSQENLMPELPDMSTKPPVI